MEDSIEANQKRISEPAELANFREAKQPLPLYTDAHCR